MIFNSVQRVQSVQNTISLNRLNRVFKLECSNTPLTGCVCLNTQILIHACFNCLVCWKAEHLNSRGRVENRPVAISPPTRIGIAYAGYRNIAKCNLRFSLGRVEFR